MKIKSLLAALTALALNAGAGEPLTQSTFTDVIKDVNIVAADTKAASPAAVNALVKAPNLVRTGPASRAELTAPDHTITRIGANSIFSFEPNSRTVNLESGSVLFHSPKGKGGGSIKSGGASAAVLGSTLIGAVGADGSFKVIFLEGTDCKVTLPNGKSVTLKPGQMVVVLPNGAGLGPVLDIDLSQLVKTSLLVNGFNRPLDSLPLIEVVITEQQKNGGKNSPRGPGGLDDNTQSTLTVPGSGRKFQPPPTTGVPPPSLNFPNNQPPGR